MTTAKEGAAAAKAAQQQDQVRPRCSASPRRRANSGSDCGSAVTFPSALCSHEGSFGRERRR